MKMNRTLAYGLACLQFLSEKSHDGAWLMVRDIARAQNLPPAYCNKVLQALVHVGLVKSSRGRGYRLAKPMERISVWEVMEAFTFNGAPKKAKPENSSALYESLMGQVNKWLVGLTLEDVIEAAKPKTSGEESEQQNGGGRKERRGEE